MDLFDLVAKITLDSSEYEKGLKDQESNTKTFGSSLKNALSTGAKVGAKVIGAVTTAAIAFGSAVVKETGQLAEYGDHVDKMSQKMGISAQAYQEWDAILQHSGTSIDSMQRGMMTLSKAAENNSEAFQALGITQEQVAAMNQEQLFEATIAGLQGMAEGTERTALAQTLLGVAAKELGPLLNSSAEDVEAMRQRVHELGGVMSDDAVKAAAAYQDSLQDMKTSVNGLKMGLFTDFMPSVTGIMDGLTMIFSGDSAGGVGKINEGVESMVTNISNALPQMLTVGKGIIMGLLDAIVSNLPQIISSGVEIIISLIAGLISAIPELVSKIPEIIMAIYDGLVAAGPELLAAGAALLEWIGQGILSMMSLAMEWGQSVGQQIHDGLVAAWDAIVSWVSTGMENIGNAISEAWAVVTAPFVALWDSLVAVVSAAWNSIVSWVGSAMSAVASTVSSVWGAISGTVSSIVSGIASTVSSIWNSIVSSVSTAVSNISSKISSGFQAARSTVSSIVSGISSTVKSVFNGIKSFLQPIVDWLAGIFDFSWDLPEIKLPHFTVSGQFSLNPPQIPTFSISWYKKAYEEPYLFSKPTVVGAMGFGDGIGGEMVYGHENLMQDIRSAVKAEIGSIAIYLDGTKLVGGTADRMDSSLGNMQKLRMRWEGA